MPSPQDTMSEPRHPVGWRFYAAASVSLLGATLTGLVIGGTAWLVPVGDILVVVVIWLIIVRNWLRKRGFDVRFSDPLGAFHTVRPPNAQ
jgi:hypothetical protein